MAFIVNQAKRGRREIEGTDGVRDNSKLQSIVRERKKGEEKKSQNNPMVRYKKTEKGVREEGPVGKQ